MIGTLRQCGVNTCECPGPLQDPTSQRRQPGLLLLPLGDRQLHRQGQRPGRHHVLSTRAEPPLLTAPARGRRQRQVAANHQGPHAHRRPQLVAAQAHRIQAPAMEVHRNLPQRRHHIRVDGHVPALAGAPGATGLPHALHQRRHVLHHAGLIVRRHHRHQGRGGVVGAARRRHSPIHRVELDPPRVVNLQQAQLRP